MSAASERRFPSVNLAAPTARQREAGLRPRWVRTALLLGLAMTAWGAFGVALAMLVGWHPHFPVGP